MSIIALQPEIEILQALMNDANNMHMHHVKRIWGDNNPFREGVGIIYRAIQKQWDALSQVTLKTTMHVIDSDESFSDEQRYAARLEYQKFETYGNDIQNLEHSIKVVWERYKIEELRDIAKTADKIRTVGITVKGKLIQGLEEADKWEAEARNKFNVSMRSGLQEGLFSDGAILVQQYEIAQNRKPGIKTGFEKIDEKTSGGYGGEVWLVSGWAGDGKTKTLINMCYNASVLQHQNSAFLTAEMSCPQVLRNFWTRHTKNPKFLGHEILYEKIKKGTLSESEQEFYLGPFKDDLKSAEYGRLEVVQCAGWTLLDVRRKLEAINKEYPLNVVYIDYLGLLKSSLRLSNPREDLEERFKEIKRLALEFGNGEQLLVVSAHQINRVGRAEIDKIKSALKLKRTEKNASQTDSIVRQMGYHLYDLAGSAEAERSCDVSIWVMRNQDDNQMNEMRIGMNKNRDGAPLNTPISHVVDFEHCYIGPEAAGSKQMEEKIKSSGNEITISGPQSSDALQSFNKTFLEPEKPKNE